MTINEVLGTFESHGLATAGIVAIFMTLIQVTPLKLNPWTAMGKFIRKIFIGDVATDIKELKETVSKQSDEIREIKEDTCKQVAASKRYRILRFDDEMCSGVIHSQDHIEEIVEDIADYEAYCEARPYIKNHKGQAAMARILDNYNNKRPM